LKIKDLRQGSCGASNEYCCQSIKSEYIVEDGDVIFSWSGSLLVDLWCGGECGLNQHLFKVTSKVYDKWFYYSWTLYHLEKFIAIASAKATTMGHIKRGDLSNAEILIPSKEDYERIGAILKPIYEMIISIRIENRKQSKIRDELLPKMMTGEIDVTEL
jgi:type I restriction enzyme S subunit